MQLDFLSGKGKVKYELLNSNQAINTKDNDLLFGYFDDLVKSRHNILHYLVLDSMNMSWSKEENISNHLQNLFNIVDLDPSLNKTPDIVVTFDNVLYLIDVSISIDTHLNEYKKKIKYEPICDYLYATHKLYSKFIHINISSSLKNAEREIQKIPKIIKEFDYLFLTDCIMIIDDKINWLSGYIDKTFFDLKKSEKYGVDSLLPQIGKYNDLDIDEVKFNEYNSKFKHLETTKDAIDNFDLDNFVENMRIILDDESNNIYQKYKDNKLTKDQFTEAKKTIMDDNSHRRKQEPKPTHHVVIPCFEEIDFLPKLIGEQSEQNMIENFSNYILDQDKTNFETFNFFENSKEKYNFVIEFLKNYKSMFENKGKNAKIYRDIFNKNDYFDENINTREMFNLWKTKCMVYYYRQKFDQKQTRMKSNTHLDLDNNNNIYTGNDKKYTVEEYVYGKLTKKGKKILGLRKTQINEIFEKTDLVSIPMKFNLDNLHFDPSISYFDYLVKCGLMENNITENAYPYKQKTLFINFKQTTESFKVQWSKTGINQAKNNPESKKWDVHDTIEIENKDDVDRMISHLSNDFDNKSNDIDFFSKNYSLDSHDATKLKEQMKEQYMPFFEYLYNTNAYDYLKKSHYITDQLLHFTCLNLKPHTFNIFNAGIPNMIYIVAGCYNSLFSELGKPFMFIAVTEKPEYYTSFFGKLKKIKLTGNKYLIISNWRRLPTFKLTHLKDTYYGVLSSTMNSLMSCTTTEAYFETFKYKNIFSLRTIISLCTNQKVSELLMDNRYAYMSAFSLYTNISKLLVEKFGPPYRCSLECWIIDRILKKLPLITESSHNNQIKFDKPILVDGYRDINSLGGKINIPSLWGDYKICDVHEIMDEAFIYVHTMKEPSSIFHEEVNALKTICDFQEQFNNLPEKIKSGNLKTFDDIKEYLLYPTKIGFCAPIIYRSTQFTINEEKPNMNKIVHEINDESISEIISTKAVIKDLDRELVEDKKYSKREVDKYMKKYKKYKKENGDLELSIKEKSEIESLKKLYLKTETNYYNNHKPRQKVFETILEIVDTSKNFERTINLANDFVCTNNAQVLADICIKSQYGSKREFYVINIGAKALARCTENFFRKLSESSPHEAISIPGDVKTLHMQKMLDRVYQNLPYDDDYNICFVNGDCTKWSAAETMGSFLTMVYAMKDKLPKNMYEVLISTFNSWSDKYIQIPTDIINKVVFPNNNPENKTLNFLHDHINKNNGKIHSTQNFLQGMFNYSSSYKAVCCTKYTYNLWKKIYPNTKLFIEHLEHSDDYVVVCVYTDIKEFEKFRVFHKIMMRLHGYNDSDRKTNCQLVFMEFVSQMSFNGVMLYPQIKKSKEINTNLPCVGYKTDMDAALSRVGECMRVGCNQAFLYFFQKLHVKCVGEFYSTLPGMYNSKKETIDDLFNTPTEMFGLPDPLPLLSLYCRGNGNNYRIYHYTNNIGKAKIKMLYDLAIKNKSKEDIYFEDQEYSYSLLTPKFMYESKTKILLKLRKKMNISPDELKKFWEEHISYRFIKPKCVDNLITWLKAMFFNRTFVEAYTKTNRTKMIMRVSNFVKDRILKIYITSDDMFKTPIDMLTILEYKEYLLDTFHKNISKYTDLTTQNKDDEIRLQKVITKCDPSYSAIYSIINNLKISITTTYKKTKTFQVAIKTPSKIRSFDLINDPSTLIQYMYNKDDFLKDNRKFKSETSLSKDIENVLVRLPKNIVTSKNPMDVLSVYNDMSISCERRIIMMGYNRNTTQLVTSICDILKFNLIPQKICDVHINEVIRVVDPFTGDLLYIKGQKLTPDLYQQILENLALLFVYMFIKMKMPKTNIREYFKNLKFIVDSDPNDDSKKTIVHVEDLLRRFTTSYFEQYNIDMTTKKNAAYLLATLYNDFTILNDLISNVYNYTYRYIKQGNYTFGKYVGETILSFTHIKTTQKIIQLEKNPEIPLLIYHNDVNFRTLSIHYNIGLRILGKLSDDEYFLTMYKNRMKLLKSFFFANIEDLEKFKDTHKITSFLKIINDKTTIMPISKFKIDEENLPVFITKQPIFRGHDIKTKGFLAIPTIDDNKLAVFVQKDKLFTLPFWKCRQYNNLLNDDMRLDGMSLKEIFNHQLLYHYYQNTLQYTNSYPFQVDLFKYIDEYKFYLNENRLYNFNYDNVNNYLTTSYPININDINNYSRFIRMGEIKSIDTEIPVPVSERYQKQNADAEKKKELKKPKDLKDYDSDTQDDMMFFGFEDDSSDDERKSNNNNFETTKYTNVNEYLKLGFTEDLGRISKKEFNLTDLIEENFDEDMGLLEDDSDLFTYQPPVPNLTREKLMIVNYNFTSSDVFVEKPYSRRTYRENIHTFSRQNYMLTRLRHTPNLPILYTMCKHIKADKYETTNIFNYIHTLGYLITKYKKAIETRDIEYKNIIYTYIYKFMTNVYINPTKNENLLYILEGGKVNFRVIIKVSREDKNTNDAISKSKNLLFKTTHDQYISYELSVNDLKIFQRYREENNLEILQLLVKDSKKTLDSVSDNLNTIDYLLDY